MPKTISKFVCQQCEYQSPSYLGKCPNCGAWGSLVETVEQKSLSSSLSSRTRSTISTKPVRLSQIRAEQIKRTGTGIAELDRVLGGGIVPGMAVLVSGEPGIGKSTLLLEMARSFGNLSNLVNLVLYIAGEESASQIKIRAQRLNVKADNILIVEETDADEIVSLSSSLSSSSSDRPGLIIVDSVQTLTTTDLAGQAGSVGQVRECAGRLIGATKPLGIPLFLVGHVTKDGAIAGPKVLEHMVDTVLYIEGDRFEGLRLIRTTKNRFGPTDEVGIFTMTDGGLVPVTDPSGLLADKKNFSQPGSCLTISMEGTRPLLVEIQALTTSTPLPYPRRVATGLDSNRLQMIIAVLQKRLNIPLYKEDIFVSVSGGIKVEEPAVDLAVALAIISSHQNKPLPVTTVAIGEIDLLGNVRRVNNLERRVKEAKKLGFKNILSSETLSSLNGFRL